MIAKYAGTCSKCGKSFAAGDNISWSRQERGKAYHEACRVTLPSPVVTGTPSESELLAMLKKLVAAMPSETKIEAASEPEVTEVSPVTTKKPVVKSTVDANSPWYEVLEAVLPHVSRILLVGPPSSGKSTTAMLAAEIKHRLTMTETTSREDLIGMFHLIDGETKYVNGPFSFAMLNGEPVLWDEIDRYSPESVSLAYSLIDDRPHVSLPTGELITAKDGYKVIMTSNEGLESLPSAVQDRIEVIIMANTPHENAMSDFTKAEKQVCMNYYKSLPVKALRLPPTVRRMKAWKKLCAAGIPSDVAGSLVFGAQGSKEVLSAITSAEGTAK